MAKKKLEDRSIRKIQKGKGMYYLSIPIELIREFGWRERQKVVVKKLGKNRIVISDWE